MEMDKRRWKNDEKGEESRQFVYKVKQRFLEFSLLYFDFFWVLLGRYFFIRIIS